jgi:hypothetical protein
MNLIAAPAAAVVFALLLFAVPARAAEPIFPIGSHIGLVPPPGMVMSKKFPGFEDSANDAIIIFATLPGTAYAEMEKSPVPQALKAQGVTVAKREPIQLKVGNGFLVTGNQVTGNKHYRKWLLVAPVGNLTALVSVQVPEKNATYSDAVVRAALMTLAVRAKVPESEDLSLLPFTIGNLSGFRIQGIVPGRALLLIDSPAYPKLSVTGGVPEPNLNARFIVTAVPGGPQDTSDQAGFARFAFGTIGGIKDVQITMSEPVRIENQQEFETVAQAKDAITGIDIMVVQWLRFGGNGFLQMVGIARADLWNSELSRLRALRDSIGLKSG